MFSTTDIDDSNSTMNTDFSGSTMEIDDCSEETSTEEREVSKNKCCLWLDLGTCNSKICSSKTIDFIYFPSKCCIDHEDWLKSSIHIAGLVGSAMDYLRHHGVITRFNEPLVTILERDLILNRLQRIISIDNPDMKICPCHRYS